MIDPRVASGLRDLTPASAIPRERMLSRFRGVFSSFGFAPIETPHIERMDVLTGKGAGSDEVLRQIFEVTNKGGTPGELALRIDLTVPLARFVARHENELGFPFKRYAIGSVFRGERPAKGRFREFTQCDFDTIGSESALADAEIALVIHKALESAGVPDFTIAMNHRGILDGLLESLGLAGGGGAVLRALDRLAKVGREAVAAELVKDPGQGGADLSTEQAARVLDFAEQGRGGPEVLDRAAQTLGSSPQARAGLENLRAILDLIASAGVPSGRMSIDLGLARGLDYYTGIVFETTIKGWERYGSVASGGRYDNLASLFTTRRLPGVGASIGLDRLLALLEEAGRLIAGQVETPVLVGYFPGTQPTTPFHLAARLRAAGIGTEVYPEPISIGRQLAHGSSRGRLLGVIVGPDEEAQKTFNLRDLVSRREDRGLAWSVLEDSVASALEVIRLGGAGA